MVPTVSFTTATMSRSNSCKGGSSTGSRMWMSHGDWAQGGRAEGLGEGGRVSMRLNTTAYISPLDGFSEHVHHILPFTVSGLEAFGPPYECSLKERRGKSSEQ